MVDSVWQDFCDPCITVRLDNNNIHSLSQFVAILLILKVHSILLGAATVRTQHPHFATNNDVSR